MRDASVIAAALLLSKDTASLGLLNDQGISMESTYMLAGDIARWARQIEDAVCKDEAEHKDFSDWK